MKRHASAVWNGTLREGTGTMATQSGTVKDTPYSFGSRFEEGAGTNPEELVGAAHAGCFSMQLSGNLQKAGMNPERVETKATVTLEKQDVGFTVTKIHLDVRAKVPGADERSFQEAAEKAKAGCPISRLLKAEITMTATLEV